MRWSRTVTLVGAHAEGEVGRVITGGVLDVPGRTMLDKMRHLDADDELRRFCLHEPRGGAHASVNLVLPPTRPEADAGFVVMQADRCHAMSGSNAMCVVTVLLETGMLAMVEPTTRVVLDTPAGVVAALATCRDGRCARVALDLVPSFVEHLDHPLEVDGLGTLAVDVAYGGDYFCLVDGPALGLAVTADEAPDMVALGDRIHRAARAQIAVRHPTIGELGIGFVLFTAPPAAPGAPLGNGNVMAGTRMDRSPCGTGSAARLAVMHARGQVEPGASLVMRSPIGSTFEVALTGTTTVDGRPAILPRVAGRAWIHAIEQLGVDPSDPWPLGFTLPDLWGRG